MAKKPAPQQQPKTERHDVFVVENSQPQGADRASWTRVEVAFPNDGGCVDKKRNEYGCAHSCCAVTAPQRRARCYLEVACIFKNVKEWEPDDRLLRRIEAAALGQVLCPRVRLIR